MNNGDGSVYRVSGFYSMKEGYDDDGTSMKMVAFPLVSGNIYIYL